MNREALGALLQLNAEKNIPREQLVASLAEAIESAYRRATPRQSPMLSIAEEDGRCASKSSGLSESDLRDGC